MYRQRRKYSTVKYAPSTDRRSENQRMMIKVRHTDYQLFACVRRAQSDFMEGIYCKNISGVLKSEILLQYPRWPLSAAVSSRIWPNFELLRVLMHIIIICRYEKDRMKNSREKVLTPFLPLKPYLLPWKPVV